jgi:hypothetical protein
LENTEPVNFPETMHADLAAMTVSASLTRRGLVGALAGVALAPPVLAAPAPIFPLRLGYARIGPDGFVHLRLDEQRHWNELQTRSGGLIETMEPIQPADMLTASGSGAHAETSPDTALQRAAGRGLSHVVLYATHDGRPIARSANFVSRAFAGLRAELGKYDRAAGEAHVLDVAGGPALVSVSADTPARNPLNLFDNNRNPEREVLAALIADLDRRLQSLARPAYEAQASIAD